MKKDCLLLVLIVLFNLTGCERPKAPEAYGPVPTEAQLKWQELERYAFIHFSMNTFTDMEWGYGDKDPQLFNPSELDCRQWCRLFKEAGMKGVILTAKHHDGFCLWPSAYTDYSVKQSPWRNGNGDLVRELADACKEYGLKLGIYLSPWDMHDERYGTDAYNDYFCNQLTELLTNYGEIFEVWFDGAKGSNAKKFEYDWQRYYDLIRKLQPKANIAICGPDIRWVGNEGGKSRKSEYSVVPCALREADRIMALSQQDENQASSLQKYNQMDEDLGSRKILEKNAYICWFPAEVDVSIRKGWFFHEKDNRNSKSAKKLFKIYLNSVGNNCTLLLNIPPTPQGEIHKKDAKNLKKLGSMIKNITANPIVYNELGELTKDNGVLDFDFNDTRKVKYVVLQEDITKSQRVELFDLYIKKANGKYKRVYKGTVIGSKKIINLKGKKAKGIRFVIRQSRSNPVIKSIGIYE